MTTSSLLAGASQEMEEVRRCITEIAETPWPVLLEGESGVGKGLAAREVYRRSVRSSGPLVTVDLGASTASLIESELFGHVEGAFTGASAPRKGAFELADRGVLFLDEIGNAPPAVQSKLLRAVEEGAVTPVGAEMPLRLNVRVLAATNAALSTRVEQGTFRWDLLTRLGAFRIRLPPLRRRVEDLDQLVPLFLRRVRSELAQESRSANGTALRIAPDAWDAMRIYHWPGNLRELLQALRRGVTFTRDGLIRAEHLGLRRSVGKRVSTPLANARASPSAAPLCEADRSITPTSSETAFARPDGGIDPQRFWVRSDGGFLSWDEGRRRHIAAALRATGGNVSRAARLLVVARTTLHRWIKELEVRPLG